MSQRVIWPLDQRLNMEEPELGDYAELVPDGPRAPMLVRVLSRHDEDSFDVDVYPNDEEHDSFRVVSTSRVRPLSSGRYLVAYEDLDGEECEAYFTCDRAAHQFADQQMGPATVQQMGQP